MLLTNHAITGSLIGLAVGNPLMAFPLGVASHYAMDSLPHFGIPGMSFRERRGFLIGLADFLSAVTVTVGLAYVAGDQAALVLAGAFGAMLPDLLYLPEIALGRRLRYPGRQFHHDIQQGREKPGRIWIDAVWAVTALALTWQLLPRP